MCFECDITLSYLIKNYYNELDEEKQKLLRRLLFVFACGLSVYMVAKQYNRTYNSFASILQYNVQDMADHLAGKGHFRKGVPALQWYTSYMMKQIKVNSMIIFGTVFIPSILTQVTQSYTSIK